MKLCFLDVETTGTNPGKNAIHQLSGKIYIDGELKENFDFHLRPFEGAEIEDDALSVGGVTKEQIMEYPDQAQVFKQFVAMLSKYVNRYDKTDKFYMVGYNCQSFDSAFIRALFKVNNDDFYGSWFWSHTLDVMILATAHLLDERAGMKNFKLSTVAEKCGCVIEEGSLHNSSYDVELTKSVYDKVCGIY